MAEAKKIEALHGVSLSDDQCSAIEEAGGWSANALAELGAAYLDYAEAESRYLKSKARLVACKGGALEAESTRGKIVASVAQTLDLPPGEWVYDSGQRKLVKKDN